MDGAIRVKGATFPITPNPPSGRYYLGVDASDGRFKKQDSAGVITDYDSGASYTNEDAQDAVGSTLTNTSTVQLTYNDAANQISAQVVPAGVNHNALLNYVADQHVPHSSIQVATASGSGLQGGGDISATRNLSLDVNGLTEKTRVAPGDVALIYDPVAGQHRKVGFQKFQRCNPDRYVFTYSDFIQSTLGDLTATVSGTGASAQAGTFGIDLTEQAQGVTQIDTGTTATGRTFLGTAVVNHLWVASGNTLRFAVRFVPELLSTNLETFICHLGFIDNQAAGREPTDGAYFRYTDAVNGGRWEAVVAAGATRQAFDTGVSAQQQYQIFEIEIDYLGANPVCRFYIDGVLTNTVNTPSPIPTGATQTFGYGARIEKTVGTGQRNASLDWYCFELERNAGR